MRSSGGLRRNLIGAIGTAIGALVLVLLLLEEPLVQFRLRSVAGEQLSASLDAFEEQVASGVDPDRAADAIGAARGVRITATREGRVIADTGFDGDELARALPLLDLGEGEAVVEEPRVPAESGDHYRAVRHVDGVRVQALLSTAMTHRAQESVRELLLLGSVMAVVVALFLMITLTRTLVTPTRELTRVADALAAGDLSARYDGERDDELGAIGAALNQMSGELGERIEGLRREQERIRTILDAMTEAVFVTDALGRITLTNHALDRLFGEGCLGRTAREAIGSEELHAAVRSARKSPSRGVDLSVDQGAKRLYFRAQVAPLPDGRGVVAVLHDVTRLQAADRIRRDFVANASHELRTPLTAIRGFAETLRDGAVSDEASAARFIDIILKHTLRLQAVVADLAALSRAESPDHRLTIQSFDASEVVEDVVRGLTAKAATRGVELAIVAPGEPLTTLASERALDQVLVNLVDNAIKYTPEGSTVTIRSELQDDRVRVAIHNPGKGIPAEHQERIFERFYRLDEGRSRDVGGTGLGLAIVKHLVAQMGGEVGVESEPDQGVTFWFALPRAPVGE